MVLQQILFVKDSIADLAFERLFRVRHVNPLIVFLQSLAIGEGFFARLWRIPKMFNKYRSVRCKTYLTMERIRIDVPLAMFEQLSLFVEPSSAAAGISAHAVNVLAVFLQVIEVLARKSTSVAYQSAKLPNELIVLGMFLWS